MPDPACPAPKQGMPVIREQQLVLVLGMHRSQRLGSRPAGARV